MPKWIFPGFSTLARSAPSSSFARMFANSSVRISIPLSTAKSRDPNRRSDASRKIFDSLLNFIYAYSQLLQLPLIHHTRRVHHQVLSRGGLWERHNIADVLRTDKDHACSLDTCSKASVRRGAVLKCVQEKSKLRPRTFRRHTECLEVRVLDRLLMNTDRAASAFVSVDHRVVSLCPHLPEQMMLGIVFHRMREHVEVLVHRRRERMMSCHI